MAEWVEGGADGGRVRPGDNPFRSEAVDGLGYCPEAVGGWGVVEARWREAGYRGALVGPRGHGKTTLLFALAQRYRGGGLRLPAGWPRAALVYRLPQGRSRLPGVWRGRVRSDRRLVAIDGYERLGWWDRWLLGRRRGPTLVTAHRPTGLPTVVQCRTDGALLGRLIGRLSPAAAARLTGAEVEALRARHGGDVRLALRELYDRAGRGEV